ncbi:hypothetical protein GQ457_04G011090 [Hibiscus cannabinus]
MEALDIKLRKRIRHGRLLKAFLFLFLDLSLCSPSQAQGEFPFMTSDVTQVAGKSFDYIVVGGGTAGCPLAATLSEKFSVLLVERGGSPYGNPWVLEKGFYGFSLIQTDEFSSVAQDFTSTDGVRNCRGRVLGGSSAINGGFYSRASEDFIDKAGWDKESVKEAYTWVESKIVSIPELTPWQTVVEFGLLEAGFLPYNGYSLEHIEGTKIGGSIFDAWGIRHTSADLLKAANPGNIVVILNATVNNIIFESNGNASQTSVKGIRFIKSDGSTDQTYEAYLNQPKNCTSNGGDVILSAGALGSPQILLLSGIGHRKHLEDLDIPHVMNLKGVGKRMKDNPCIAVLVDTDPQNRQPEPPQVSGIAKDFKFIIEGGVIPTSFNATRMPIAAKIAFPASEGELRLNSSDPRQNPSVKFNYLDDEKDLDACAEMVQLLERVARSHPVAFYLGVKRQSNLMTSTDEQRKFCKENVKTYYHYHGGCTVGSVVDSEYKVYGVTGLRVVDGSTFRESPGTNPMATLMMLGRYQGLKILRERDHVSFSLRTQQNP